jgi:hypothetical protein
LDDISARCQTEIACRRNSQASPAKGPGFAIRCRHGFAYAHKCRADLPSIVRPFSGAIVASFHSSHASRRPLKIRVPPGQFIGGRFVPDAGLRFKSVPIDFAATQRGAWPHAPGADRTACRRAPSKPQLSCAGCRISQYLRHGCVLQSLRHELVAFVVQGT